MRDQGLPIPMDMAGAGAVERAFLLRVYHWMTLGLALTGIVSLYVASNRTLLNAIASNSLLFYGLMIGELGLVFYLAARVMKMSVRRAMAVFLFYSALNGVTLSFIFLVYTQSTIASAFFVTAGTFAAMSFFGYTTKMDLSGVGSFCFMGLIGLIIASVVNIFLKNPMLYWVTSYAGVLIFVGLTAWDTQKLKKMSRMASEGTDVGAKLAISGALALYLDFINLFLFILTIMGGRRR